MSERQSKRMVELIFNYHTGEMTGFLKPSSCPGYFKSRHDGSDVELELIVGDDEAERAASEFRACGFVMQVGAA
jgi:hypothetical protein